MPGPVRVLSKREAVALALDASRGAKVRDLAQRYGVSERTVYRTLRRDDEALEAAREARIQPCGTNAAYQRHRYRGELACEACLAAHREDYHRRSTKPKGKRRI